MVAEEAEAIVAAAVAVVIAAAGEDVEADEVDAEDMTPMVEVVVEEEVEVTWILQHYPGLLEICLSLIEVEVVAEEEVPAIVAAEDVELEEAEVDMNRNLQIMMSFPPDLQILTKRVQLAQPLL